jgi:hypothetical protein
VSRDSEGFLDLDLGLRFLAYDKASTGDHYDAVREMLSRAAVSCSN